MKILVRQNCGLGNQLFQYSAGLYFARQLGAKLQIVSEPEDLAVSLGHPRPFLLSKFLISAPVRERNGWDRLMCSVATKKKPLAVPARFLSRTRVYEQGSSEAWLFFSSLPLAPMTQRVYLGGFFQAHQFAKGVEPELRRELQFREAPTGENIALLEQIRASECPVSLHVRRGDYNVKGKHHALPIVYYSNAIEAVREHIANPTFFVFSDDIAFARENLPTTERMVFVDHNDEANGHEDLRLMSECRHHIIANSTFSWWGAWLNGDPAKRVFAPDRWLDSTAPHTDLIPPDWQRISTKSITA